MVPKLTGATSLFSRLKQGLVDGRTSTATVSANRHRPDVVVVRLFGTEVTTVVKPDESTKIKEPHPPSAQVLKFLRSEPHLNEILATLPNKYLHLKRRSVPENLYLIDKKVAAEAVDLIWNELAELGDDTIVSETNAGFGFITRELLNRGMRLVRMYESCGEFRAGLRELNRLYPGRIELFAKDFFQMYRISYLDKLDRGNRIEQLTRGIQKREQDARPTMTLIGPLPTSQFLWYLTRSIAQQTELGTFGRFRFYCFLRPEDYLRYTAEPPQYNNTNLHTYQRRSVLFRLMYEWRLLAKYERKRFLPWETKRTFVSMVRYAHKIDSDLMYFVRIDVRHPLPVESSRLLALYHFVMQMFGRGGKRVIPVLEKWIPGCGANLIAPRRKYRHYYENLDIYTTFGELSPNEILSIFNEVSRHPSYPTSPFLSMIDGELMNKETIPTDLNESNTIMPKHEDYQERFE